MNKPWRPGTRKWSKEQIAAVVRLQVDGGETAKQSVARCASQCIDGLPPFDMPHTTASWYAAQERRLRDGRGRPKIDRPDIRGTQEAVILEAIDVVGRQLGAMYTASGRPRKTIDLGAFTKLTRSILSISQAISALEATKGHATGPARSRGAKRREADFFRGLDT